MKKQSHLHLGWPEEYFFFCYFHFWMNYSLKIFCFKLKYFHYFENWKTRKAAFNIKFKKEWTQHIWSMFLIISSANQIIPFIWRSNLVIVPSRGEVLVVRWPLEAAHFLPVALEASLHRRRCPHVPLQNHSVPATRRQLLSVPRKRSCERTERVNYSESDLNQQTFRVSDYSVTQTYACWMSLQTGQLPPSSCVPNLDKSFMGPYSHQTSLREPQRRNDPEQSQIHSQMRNLHINKRFELTLSFQHTDVTESPSTDKSHNRVTCVSSQAHYWQSHL